MLDGCKIVSKVSANNYYSIATVQLLYYKILFPSNAGDDTEEQFGILHREHPPIIGILSNNQQGVVFTLYKYFFS